MKIPTETSKLPAVIVFERKPHWAPLFRQNQPDHPVVETRIWDNLIDEIVARPGSVLCIEAEKARIERALTQIRRLRSRFYANPIIAACPRAAETIRSIALECGAQAVVCSPLDVRKVSSTLTAHFNTNVPPEQTLEQRISDRLPWKNQATKF